MRPSARIATIVAVVAAGAAAWWLGSEEQTQSEPRSAAAPPQAGAPVPADSPPGATPDDTSTAAPPSASATPDSVSRAGTGGVALDTVRGFIALIGSAPAPRVALRAHSAPAAQLLVLKGEHVEALGKLTAIDVWLAGRLDRTRNEMLVTDFAVRSVDGVPATDGRLAGEGNALILVSREGRRRIVNPPAALRAMVGYHVWIAGPADAEPVAFGLIRR